MPVYMTRDEVRAFGDKLDTFGRQLSPTEQELLREILVRAALATGDDVHGHSAADAIADDTPLSTYLSAAHDAIQYDAGVPGI